MSPSVRPLGVVRPTGSGLASSLPSCARSIRRQLHRLGRSAAHSDQSTPRYVHMEWALEALALQSVLPSAESASALGLQSTWASRQLALPESRSRQQRYPGRFVVRFGR